MKTRRYSRDRHSRPARIELVLVDTDGAPAGRTTPFTFRANCWMPGWGDLGILTRRELKIGATMMGARVLGLRADRD